MSMTNRDVPDIKLYRIPDTGFYRIVNYRIQADTGFTGYRILYKVDDAFLPNLRGIYLAVRLL